MGDFTLEISTFSIVMLLLIFGTWASQAASRTLHEPAHVETLHEQWMARYGRTYADDGEKEMRLRIFKDNLNFVENFNKDPNQTYKLSINQFTDLTNEEFLSTFTGYKQPDHRSHSSGEYKHFFRYEDVTDVPPSMDWRTRGAVMPVRNQGRCNCCWAFSAVAAVESATIIKTGLKASLSPQQLVDCATGGGNKGCNGGWMDTAFEYIIQNKGITTESNYPYKERDGSACPGGLNSSVLIQISGYEDVPPNNEEALLKAVSVQPVSVAIEGMGLNFQMYKSGVFSGDCGTELNHAVTVVGYGKTVDEIKYWLVKNSWGEGWGEGGYMKIKRDVESPQGLCGLAQRPSYPII